MLKDTTVELKNITIVKNNTLNNQLVCLSVQDSV